MADNLRTRGDPELSEHQAEHEEKTPDSRTEELSKRASVREALLELYKDLEKGFLDQQQRSEHQMDYWDCYNCKLGPHQAYSGNSRLFVPIVHNAINARKTRFTNQIFPVSGRYVEVTTQDNQIPHSTLALAEHYVRKCRLRTEVMPALMRNGDVEGQYNLYVGWRERTRHVAWKVWKPAEVEGLEDEEDIEDIQEETLIHGAPYVEVLADADVLVLPQTSDSIDEAIEGGGSVTIIRRWSKAKITQMIDDGEIDAEAGEGVLTQLRDSKDASGYPNKEKEMV